MKTITATKARSDFFNLMDQVELECEPMLITGRRTNVVIISESDWRSIKETMYLDSIPGMRESIEKASLEPLSECVNIKDLGW